jgi:hypothetical protein
MSSFSFQSATAWLQLDMQPWLDYLLKIRTTVIDYPMTTAFCSLLAAGWILKRVISSKLDASLRKTQEVAVYRYKRSFPLGIADIMMIKAQHYLDSGRSTACMHVTGPLTPQLLRNGLILLQQRHPQLRLGIHTATKGNSGYYFHEYHEPQEKIVCQVRKRKGESHWMEVMEELSNSYRPCIDVHDSLLWDVVFLENADSGSCAHGTKHEILITACHAIMDGTSRVIFHTDLLDCIAKAHHAQEKKTASTHY